MLELAREDDTVAKARCSTSSRHWFFFRTVSARSFCCGRPSANFLERAATEDTSVAGALWSLKLQSGCCLTVEWLFCEVEHEKKPRPWLVAVIKCGRLPAERSFVDAALM